MEIKLQLQGQEADEDNLRGLQDWLKQSDIEGMRIEREASRPAEGKMGDLATVLSVVLGSAAVVEMVKAVQVWLRLRKRNVRIKIKIDGKEVELDAENLADDEAVATTAAKLIEATK